jgi:hypothetical protein
MNYFFWQNRRNPGEAMIYGGWPKSGGLSMISGNRLSVSPGPITIHMDIRSQGVLTDSLLMTGPGRVFSRRLLDLLRMQGVDNIEAYPCLITNMVNGEHQTDFAAVNVVGKIRCVNRRKSRFEDFDDGSNRILAWDYLVLDEDEIGGQKLFCLAEMPIQLVVHRSVKEAIEAAGMTGMEFIAQGDQSFDFGQAGL